MGPPKPTESLPTELVGFRAAVRRNSESHSLCLKERRRHPSVLRQVSRDRISFQRQISSDRLDFQRRSSNRDSLQRQISSETIENLPFRRRSTRASFSTSLPKFTYVCSYIIININFVSTLRLSTSLVFVYAPALY